MNLVHWLARAARLSPASPAVFHGEIPLLDYGQLHGRVMALAGALPGLGLQVGDRVALWMANRPEYLEILNAVWAAGGVVVPVNHKLHSREVEDILRDADATLLFTDADDAFDDVPCRVVRVDRTAYAEMVAGPEASAVVERRGDDLAWLFYTSGTTGRSKGAMLSFGNLIAMAQAYLVDVDPEARRRAMLYAAPLSHGAGLYALAQFLIGGVHVVPASQGFDPPEILGLAASGKLPPLSFFAAPTMVRRLVMHARSAGLAGEGIGLIVYGGGPMYGADIETAIDVLGDRFAQIYGQGESPMTITCLPRATIAARDHAAWRARIGSVGIAHSCIALRIAGPDGAALPPGRAGEILVRGPTVMQGYWRNPAASEATLADGWLRTGDIGLLDEDGFLTLTDRAKDVIISGGTNIYPREVEEVLLTHPDIEQASVVGVSDPEWGENVAAFVVARAGATLDPAELDRFCLDRMARFKRPKLYRVVADLPKNAYGKVVKTALRALL